MEYHEKYEDTAFSCFDKIFILDLNLDPMTANMFDVAKYIMTNGDYQIVAFYKDNSTWSLYSNGDYDVSAFCKKFRGGGHKCAAGITCKKDDECYGINNLLTELTKFFIKSS